ncbi:MAG: hypothetical protein LLF76_03030 [Planctomycetaceae bacterium]|nr:hypothetical protein [Planctomycetaceae bacterium]
MKKRSLITAAVICATALLCMGAGLLGQATNENRIPLSPEAITAAGVLEGSEAPYVVLQRWGDGQGDLAVYNASTGAVTTTYGEASVRFAQNAVTGQWYATIPATQPDGDYLGFVCNGQAGAEAKTDKRITVMTISWNKTNGLKIGKSDVFGRF